LRATQDGLAAVRAFELENGAFTEEERAAARRRLAEDEAALEAGRKKRTSG
jgi:hypothetical protein